MKHRILIILTTKLSANGIAKSVMNYYQHLNKRQFQIELIAQNEADENMLQEFIQNDGHAYILKNRSKKPFSYMKKLKKIIKKNKYDIVHVHGSSRIMSIELFVAKIQKVPIIIPHSHSSSSNYKFLHKALKFIFNKLYTYPVACGELAAEWMYGKKEVKILRNGIDIENYQFNNRVREKIRKDYNVSDNELLIGHVGHFIYAKNHEFLIEIIYELNKLEDRYKLMLIGNGGNINEIKRKVKEKGLKEKVLFLGTVKNVPDFLQAFDIIIHPSRFEGVPLTLIEAQAANLPCIVSQNVSKEVQVTDLVTFKSLDLSAVHWAKDIHDTYSSNGYKKIDSDQIKSELKVNGYDIRMNAKELEELYKTLLKKEVL